MEKLRISIITVSYNSQNTIKTTLDSINNQEYNNIEHLIIDGGSTDNTISIIKKYPHIKKFITEPDEGIYYAMNKGIKVATGDIIGFLNSDDFYVNNEVLSKVARVFNKNPSLEACYANLVYVDQNDLNRNVRYWKSCNYIPGLFSKGWCPPHLTFFVRTSIYKKYGIFNLKYKIAADVELMMRFLEVNKINVCYIPDLWVKMRLGGTTNKNLKNILKQNKEILHALKTHKLSFNWISFFIYKIISRTLQFIKKLDK
jgi:glycosyltransferase involved in cell wall biosynthesis